MIGKQTLALALNMSTDGFRLLLREMEQQVPGFFTGRKKTLTPGQESQIRTYLQNKTNTATALA